MRVNCETEKVLRNIFSLSALFDCIAYILKYDNTYHR